MNSHPLSPLPLSPEQSPLPLHLAKTGMEFFERNLLGNWGKEVEHKDRAQRSRSTVAGFVEADYILRAVCTELRS